MFDIIVGFLILLGVSALIMLYAGYGLIYALVILSILITFNGIAKGNNI